MLYHNLSGFGPSPLGLVEPFGRLVLSIGREPLRLVSIDLIRRDVRSRNIGADQLRMAIGKQGECGVMLPEGKMGGKIIDILRPTQHDRIELLNFDDSA